MKAKLLKKVRGKISLQQRNRDYYVFVKKELKWIGKDLPLAKRVYIMEVILLATEIFKPKCKNRLL